MGIEKITLVNISGQSAFFGGGVRKSDGLFVMKSECRDTGYSKGGRTDRGEIKFSAGQVFVFCGDLWRFIEGSLGVGNIHFLSNLEYGYDTLCDFRDNFYSVENDDEALLVWNELVSNIEWLPEEKMSLSFYVGGLNRRKLECLADYVSVDFNQHLSSDDLRSEVLDSCIKKGVFLKEIHGG